VIDGVGLLSRSRLLNDTWCVGAARLKGPVAGARVLNHPPRGQPFGVVLDEGRMRAVTVANPIGHFALPTCPAPRIMTVLIVLKNSIII